MKQHTILALSVLLIGSVDLIEDDVAEVEIVEKHKFTEIQNIYWRNSDISFKNKISLIKLLLGFKELVFLE